MKNKILFIALVGFIALGLTGCSERYTKTDNEDFTLNANGKTKIIVDNINGDITVVKSDDPNTIKISAIKEVRVSRRDKDKPLDEVKIDVDESGNTIRVETKINDGIRKGLFRRRVSYKVTYKLFVPANMDVDIHNVSGDINVAGNDGNIRIDVVNSDITLNKVTGRIDIESVNGKVDGNIYSSKGIVINSINGKIDLFLSENINARINADVVNGRINHTGLDFKNQIAEKRSFIGILGQPDIDINIDMVNGRIEFSRLIGTGEDIREMDDITTREVYIQKKEELEKAQENLRLAEEEFQKAREEYMNTEGDPDSLDSDSIETEKSDTVHTL